MPRELGVFAQLQISSEILTHPNCTIAFCATTQEGVHINAALITTEKSAFVVAIDQLPGGTAEDYANHISDSIDDLASVYKANHPKAQYQETRKQLINNILKYNDGQGCYQPHSYQPFKWLLGKISQRVELPFTSPRFNFIFVSGSIEEN